IRQSVSKTSTAKYKALHLRSKFDGRLRDTLLYCGAERTGRWAGRGVQPHNFPRPTIIDIFDAIELVRAMDVEGLSLGYGDILQTLPSCLRATIVAPKNKKLLVADYNAVEA